MPNLTNVLIKIDRAGELLELCNSELKKFVESNPYAISLEPNLEERVVLIRAVNPQPIPINIRILAGEVVTHLRSTLDHIVWQLGLLRTAAPNKRSQFPIYETQKGFRDAAKVELTSISQEHKEIISELQPFHDAQPRQHPLWMLNRLANDDKHRLVTIVGASIRGILWTTLPNGVSLESEIGPLNDNGILGKLDYKNYAHDYSKEFIEAINPGVYLEFCLSVDGVADIQPVYLKLMQIKSYVKKIAERFELLINP